MKAFTRAPRIKPTVVVKISKVVRGIISFPAVKSVDVYKL